jgi:hypothetical protein
MTPRSRVAHEYELAIPAAKLFYLERNRYFMLANIFRVRTLTLLLPVLAAAEIGVWCFALRSRRGLPAAKLRSYMAVALSVRSVLRQRRRVQAIRRVPDRALLDVLDAAFPASIGQGGSGLTRIANAFFSGYNWFLRRAVRW